MDDRLAWSLRRVLAGLRFPAEHWQIVTAAELYGADSATRELLRNLPVGTAPYRDLDQVAAALDRVPRA
jgi:Protein of unknown function (DUF2795)